MKKTSRRRKHLHRVKDLTASPLRIKRTAPELTSTEA